MITLLLLLMHQEIKNINVKSCLITSQIKIEMHAHTHIQTTPKIVKIQTCRRRKGNPMAQTHDLNIILSSFVKDIQETQPNLLTFFEIGKSTTQSYVSNRI